MDDAPAGRRQPVDASQGEASSPLAPGNTTDKPKRPWFKKKRFLSPIALVLVIGWIGSLGGDDPADTAPLASTEQQVSAGQQEEGAPEEPTAEEVAAEEAEEAAQAEADRVAAEQRAAEEAAAAEAERVAAEQAAAAAAAEEAARGTISQQNAFDKGGDYLAFTSFSRSGLVEQLEFEGFTPEDAEFGVARLEASGAVDWNAQAAEKAAEYLEFTSFSRSGLIEQLEFEGFTPEQAEHGASTTGL